MYYTAQVCHVTVAFCSDFSPALCRRFSTMACLVRLTVTLLFVWY